MAVTSPYILAVNSTYYDLRKVVSWWDTTPQTVPNSVTVRFQDTPEATVLITKTVFEAAMQAAQDAGGY